MKPVQLELDPELVVAVVAQCDACKETVRVRWPHVRVRCRSCGVWVKTKVDAVAKA
jgi:uncharacterized Zn finger protein